jgi:outer membrane protein TolC
MWLLGQLLCPVSGWSETLSLDNAIETGLSESPLLKSAGHEVKAAFHGKQAAMGEFMPRIDAYAGYMRGSDPAAVVPIKEFGGRSPVFSRDHYSYGLAMTIPIFEGGRNWTRLSLAEISEAISRESLHLSRQELVAGITNTFNRILYLEELVKSRNTVLEAVKKARADVKVRLDVGRVPPVDLMHMDTRVAFDEQALTSAMEESERTRRLLARMLGREPSWSFEPIGVLGEPSDNDTPLALSIDIENRPDIRKARKQVELARKQVELMQGYHLPTLALSGDYGRRAGSGFEGDEEVWQAGVGLTFNLFSGGAVEARIHQARASALAAEEKLRQARLVAMAEVENAMSAIRESRKRFVAAETALESAREAWRIEKLKYDAGAGTVTDCLLAQASWSDAAASRLGALYAYHAALVAWRLAAGIIDAGYGRCVEGRTGR